MAFGFPAALAVGKPTKFLSLPNALRQRDGQLAPRLLPTHPLYEEFGEDTDTELQRARARAFLP